MTSVYRAGGDPRHRHAGGRTRHRTLLERVDFYLSYRASRDRIGTEALVSQLARLLDLGAVGLPEPRQMAIDGGMGGLAAQLASLSLRIRAGPDRMLEGSECRVVNMQPYGILSRRDEP